MGEPFRNPSSTALMPRTRLGKQLLRIREKIIASGEPLLSWEEIEREVADRRGEAEHRG
jgi:hypothetical protein